VDAGFLELVRYGIRPAGDPLMEDSLRVVDAALKVDTPYGPCWKRYNHDGYGPRLDGKAYEGWGEGRAWPLLTGERAHYELAAGRDARPFIAALENFASDGGMLPEQVWDQADLPSARMCLGKPSGSAMPLMWAHAEYIKLLRSVADGQVFDRIEPVAARYLNRLGRRDLEIWTPTRQVREIAPGKTLRVMCPGHFHLRWSLDEGETHQEAHATSTGLDLSYVDIALGVKQAAGLRFTFLSSEMELLKENATHVVRLEPGQLLRQFA